MLITLHSLLSSRQMTTSESHWLLDQMACPILVPFLGLEYSLYSFFQNDCANMPFMMMQSAESINSVIARNFVLTDGKLTAYGPDDSIVGVSNQVANNSGQLSFLRPDNDTIHHRNSGCYSAKVYCELVSRLIVYFLGTSLTRNSSTQALMESSFLTL